ncbi:MAG: hypothetical protein QXU71_01375 [Candidatus Aenigmatarchaeota archaeon]
MIDKYLFLRYALPCAKEMIKRKEVSKEYIEKIKYCIKNKEKIKEDYLKTFPIAYSFCKEIGKKIKRNAMDEEVIRRYFWFEHDKVVDILGSKIECKIFPGKVEKIKGKKATLITPIGEKICSLDLAKDIKEGDFVTLHYNYVVEKISKKDAEILWKYKEHSI